MRVYFRSYVTCPCCSDIHITSGSGLSVKRHLCTECLEADCEPNREGAFDDCQQASKEEGSTDE